MRMAAAMAAALAAMAAALALIAAAPAATPRHWHPPQRLTWYWQLTGHINNNVAAQVYDVDGFETSAAEVARLHALGRHVICYIDVGTWEDFRPDAKRFPRSVLGRPNGWPGERWLDIRRTRVIEPIMRARFRMCARKHFDAIEPDNMDGFENRTGFRISARQQLAYNEWIARTVHQLHLAVLQKNDPEQAKTLEPYFDGVLDEQCNQYHECAAFKPYLKAGKPVLNAEYEARLYPKFCAADARAGIMGALYNLQLNGRLYRPCWPPGSAAGGRGRSRDGR